MKGERIIVAVDASKEVTKYALEWAVFNVAKASDSLILLVLVPSNTFSQPNPFILAHQSKSSQIFSCMLKQLKVDRRKDGGSSKNETVFFNGVGHHDIFYQAKNVYLNMIRELCFAHDVTQVQTKVKVVDLQLGSVALKAEELQASWVILDRHLKRESDYCLKQLKCNVVLVDHTIPKIFKAMNFPLDKNLKRKGYRSVETESGIISLCRRSIPRCYVGSATARNSLDTKSPVFKTDLKSLYFNEAQLVASESRFQRKLRVLSHKPLNFIAPKSKPIFLANPLFDKSSYEDGSKTDLTRAPIDMKEVYGTLKQKIQIPQGRSAYTLESKHLIFETELLTLKEKEKTAVEISSPLVNRTSNLRDAMSLYFKQPPNPPPLCSICKHNSPIFGKAPRKFGFKEIERATNGFSRENFLGEGGFGLVYKGVLSNGQVIAVKQHKMLSSQGLSEFCSEVEVLSCAQHKNLVMLVGYCVETELQLVYEFSCNASLDNHLYGTQKKKLLSWKNRMRVAIGAARGLRYLHEDCRVGCIIHRDFRPSNILLTHDFEPMVGDFGLACWKKDRQSTEETRVIGPLGYFAPEYTLNGIVTEKTDVYAFGVVLLELLSGLNVTEFSRKTGHQYVSEWGSMLHESMNVKEIIDPVLENNFVLKEVECMMVAARLCISLNADQRPRISKVLKILEGDIFKSVL